MFVFAEFSHFTLFVYSRYTFALQLCSSYKTLENMASEVMLVENMPNTTVI